MFWWITLWADNIFTILWWLLPWFASKSRDRCSICLAQLRQKAHKPKKNSVNLECKNLQIFLTVVDKVLCPHTPQTKMWKISICQNRLPKSHYLGLQYFHHVFSVSINKSEITVAGVKCFTLHPLTPSLTHWITHGKKGMKSDGFSPELEELLSPSPNGLFHLSFKR